MNLVRHILIIMLVLFISLSCSKKENNIKIGSTAFLTGKLANIGKSIQYGIELAVSELNANGGINGKRIKLILEDEGDNPQKAVSAVQKLISIDQVPVIIGPISSSSVMAVAPIANKKKVVILSPGAASPNITFAGDYIFRNRAAGTLEAIEISKFAYEELGLRQVIIFKINQDYGEGFSKVFKNDFENYGGKIILVDSYDQGVMDFRTQLSKFKKYNYDGIYVIGVPNEVGRILKQAKEIHIQTTFLMNNMENSILIKIAGKAAEGIYFPIPYFDVNSPNKNVRHFVDKYSHIYKEEPDLFAANGYDAVYIVKYAIEKGGYSGEQIKNILYSIKGFQVVSGGTISFDKNGDVIQKLVVKTVKNGKFLIVENK